MIRTIAVFFFCFGLWCVAQAQLPTTQAGGGKPGGGGGGGGGYVGPGDIVSGAIAYWGLWGYNATYSNGTNPSVDLVDQAGANPITINIKTNGQLDTGAISTWVTAHSVTTIMVKKLYDQIGTQHLSQATLANMPSLVLSSVNGFPTINANGSSQILDGALAQGGSTAQPYTIVNMAATSSLAANQGLTWYQTCGCFDVVFTTSPVWQNSFSSAFNSSATPDTNPHVFQVIANGASGLFRVDTTEDTGNNGTGSLSSTEAIELFNFIGSHWNGKFGEKGIWPIGFNGTQRGNMYTNVRTTRWGF